MRTPLSWLRDFAPFGDDVDALTATLDDLGLVVEAVERVGEGLEDVVVARVTDIAAIDGADRIRRVVVDAGAGPLEIVCGAWNFAAGDLVPLAPVGAVLPNGMAIAQRRMRGVESNGMLCSGQELGVSADGEGLLVLNGVEGAAPGRPVTEVLGIEPDVVFDVTVEGNRPDAWCIAGVARDLAARLGLPFALPVPVLPAVGPTPVGDLATLVLQAPDLCPRMIARVLVGVAVGPSPRWIARRLQLAGMRAVNNVVDTSNYVMLELGQPTHPYDLARLGGPGLLVRPAQPGETIETLDGTVRTLGVHGSALGDTGEDCLICDATGTPVGIGGVMGGAATEISDGTSAVLLECAYFAPMAIARTARRVALRTEASARFERGTDPWGLDRAADRFCELLALTSPGATLARGTLDVRGEVPEPIRVTVELAQVNDLLGTSLTAEHVAALIGPLGFECQVGQGRVAVVVPTNRPDVRPPPYGVADVIEEVARCHGYSRIPRRQPQWPQPGGLTARQRDRRRARDAMIGLGAEETVTSSMVSPNDPGRMGEHASAVGVANPLSNEESRLRRSLLPGLLRSLAWNVERRQGAVRLFEVGNVFLPPVAGRSGGARAEEDLPIERETLAAVFAGPGDDARSAVAAWHTLAETLRLTGVEIRAPQVDQGTGPDGASGPDRGSGPSGESDLGEGSATADSSAGRLAGLHPTRSALLVCRDQVVGTVGEVDPMVTADFGAGSERVGWLELDLRLILDDEIVPRRTDQSRPVSRFPSSDVDLALVTPDGVPADRLAGVLRAAGGELLQSVELFDVFRGESIGDGRRSLTFRLRFCSLERTMTDDEVGALRRACIDAAAKLGAVLR